MAHCGSVDGVKLSLLDESYLKLARARRKFDIKIILSEVEELKEESDKQSEMETEKRKLRINKILRQVNKLCKEDSGKTHENFLSKTTELRITKKAVRLYMFDKPMGKLMYDRDSTGYNNPLAVQDFEVYVQAAIHAYNKRHSTKYKLEEVVRAFRSLPIDYIYSLYFTFTAKLDYDAEADANANAKTFQAVIGFARREILVLFVDIADARATSRLPI